MTAQRPMLEALLARVRQRAAQPRERGSGAARQASAASAAAITEAPPARAMLAGDEDIEEYDDELIEVIDDGDVESEVESDERPALPLELSASAPSIELRRPAPQAGARQNEPGPVTARAASAPAGRGSGPAMMSSRPPAAARSAPEPAAALQAEAVARRPVPATSVVQAHGARPALGEQRFIDLLDASLELGN
jgi:hypothetical protein